MLSPKVEARLLQELKLKPSDKVLEIGTGSGYMTALLASLAKQVYSVDIVPAFVDAAELKLTALGLSNVTLEVGDAARGWAKHAPFDAILVSGSEPILAQELIAQLNPGGRLIAFVGEAPAMAARRITVIESGVQTAQDLFETNVRALVNAPQKPQFVF